MTDDITIEKQCGAFNDILRDKLGKEGKYYTYGTIDKNDFVVCIRSRHHMQTVEAIKKLHSTKSSVVYSYSVLSVANRVLNSIDEDKYPYLFVQYVDSICLKGITNSFNPYGKITLDQRYYEFCDRLVDRLYPAYEKKKAEKERLYRIYDILGDDDFRLIAREVNLGKLLREFKPKGQLGYFQSELRFYLYSSSLVLNTMTPPPRMRINDDDKRSTMQKMDEKMKSPICERLESSMKKIIKVLRYNMVDEKKVIFCQSLWQLLQSLKVLESAPAKKYDFYSLYHPFSALVRILESKMEQNELGSNDEIYEFIHKISMTLHGTLRTDIQFFQIRDFNVIVHYAPAKLRAFYAIWALKLSEFYNSFEETDKKYSFILAPGVFGETHVKQLFIRHDETERLMLITTPERNLYAPRWLAVIIAHEVSHYVGTKIRERPFRHKAVQGDVISDAIFRFKTNTREQDIMIMVYGYIKGLCAKQDGISEYKSIYNPENSDGTFSGSSFDFANDKNVFKLLVSYLLKCADTYFKQLVSDEKLCSLRTEKLSLYRALACESVTDMMQAVENFLHEHEKGLADGAKS